ncbi:MAG: hypothetical protein ABJC89_05605 [Acidobacteriota bacterium]
MMRLEMYRELDAGRITTTALEISRRIAERFPGSGLSEVSVGLCSLADASALRAERLRRPNLKIRIGVTATVLVMVAIAASAALSVRVPGGAMTLSDLAQGLEAAVNDVIFLGLALFFLLSLESRSKRRVALDGLNDLRSIAHVIDMHQLTKDPEIERRLATDSDATGTLTRVELARYLDYCSELLSITSKLAALHLQAFSDPVVLDSVNGIQALTVGLSGKIWQKIMILDLIAAPESGIQTSL